MITRRTLFAAPVLLVSSPASSTEASDQASFNAYLASFRVEARRAGISAATIDRTLTGLRINQRAIELDRHQPESTLTWAQYRARIVSDQRIAKGRVLYAQNRALLARVTQQYGVPAGVIMGIWALESDYGAASGDFNIIQCLATLAWEGRRRAFFQSELIDALKVIERGDVTAANMIGSYAGAMGQTQFMPDSVLKYAVDFEGNGKRDLWHSLPDIFASTANYLAKEGWQAGVPWGQAVRLPAGFNPQLADHAIRKPSAEWRAMGLAVPALPDRITVGVALPGRPDEEAFLVYYPNYKALRSYNPPDKYCLSVGLLGDAITA
jgi:membrane-bound lytic murein transglycosylase B